MQVEGAGGRIFGGYNRTKRNSDGERKDEGSIGVANTQVCQRYSKVLRIGKLLLLIYTRLCINSKTIT